MGMNVLYARIYVHHAGAWYPQRSEEVLDPLELELQKVVSCYVASGKQTQILWKSS